MGFFKALFGKSEGKPVEKKEPKGIIGGFRKSDLDTIKATYKPDNRFTAKVKVYGISKNEVLDLLRKGFNPNYIENSFPKFLYAEDIDVLKVLEYFGADARLETDLMKKITCLGWMNPNLLDFYKDILLKVDQSKLNWTHNLKVIERYQEFGISFKPHKAKYQVYESDFIWRSIVGFKNYDNFKMSEEDKKVSKFILEKTDFRFDDEVSIDVFPSVKKVFVWHLYFKHHLIGENQHNPQAYSVFLETYKDYIDYTKKSSEGYSLLDVIDIDGIKKDKEEIVKILKKYGIDPANHSKDVFERRKSTTYSKKDNEQEKVSTSLAKESGDNDEEKDQKTVIDQATLDSIKATYKPDSKYTGKPENYKGENYYTLPRHRIVEALKKGLNPNQVIAFYSKNEGIVPFMMVSHVEDLAILEQFGADIHLKTDLKNKIRALGSINFKLFDYYQDFLMSSNLKDVARIVTKKKLEWFKSKGYDFKIPTNFKSIDDVPLWTGLTWLHYEKAELNSPLLVEYIQSELNVDMKMEVKVTRKKVEYSYLYWFLLLAKQIRNYDFWTPLKSMEDLITLMDIYKDKIDFKSKTSDGRSFYSAMEVIPERLHMAFTETLFSKGIPLDLEDSRDEILVKKQEDPEFIKFIRELELSYPDESKDRFKDLTVIGGIQRSVLDEIKSIPEVKEFKYYDYTHWGSEYSPRKFITSENLIDTLKLGFNPAHPNDDFPLFLLAENQAIFEVFEYMGAPVYKNLRQYPFKNLNLVSTFMFERYVDDFMKMDHKIFMSISDLPSLQLLKKKGLDFNKAQNGSESGWRCFNPYAYKDEGKKAARRFLIEECGLDFNAQLEVYSPVKKLNAWFLYSRAFFGDGNVVEKSRREQYTTRFEDFLKEYKDKFSIYDLTENGENFYFVFADANPSYLLWIVEYLLNRFGLNPDFKNNDGISLVDYIGKKEDKYAKVLKYLNEHPYRNDPQFNASTNHLTNFDSFSNGEKSSHKGQKETANSKNGITGGEIQPIADANISEESKPLPSNKKYQYEIKGDIKSSEEYLDRIINDHSNFMSILSTNGLKQKLGRRYNKGLLEIIECLLCVNSNISDVEYSLYENFAKRINYKFKTRNELNEELIINDLDLSIGENQHLFFKKIENYFENYKITTLLTKLFPDVHNSMFSTTEDIMTVFAGCDGILTQEEVLTTMYLSMVTPAAISGLGNINFKVWDK